MQAKSRYSMQDFTRVCGVAFTEADWLQVEISLAAATSYSDGRRSVFAHEN